MGTIVAFENVSLDGVTQDPTAEEGFNREDWRAGLAPTDREEWAKRLLDDALGAQALLLVLPSEPDLALAMSPADPAAIHEARDALRMRLSVHLTD